ncbi:MAG: ATPase [Gammaproteobacteria bacterium]|nr:MAG: ATPase [Gammaproteobacteria bacterium]
MSETPDADLKKQLEAERKARRHAEFEPKRRESQLLSLNNVLTRSLAEARKLNQELKASHEQLQESHRQLLQSEKMASLGQLSAGIAHEINNPVGFIHSNLGTLEGYLDDLRRLLKLYERHEHLLPDEARADIADLKDEIDYRYLMDDLPLIVSESREGTERVRQIVQDLKEFSRTDEGRFKQADLTQIIESSLNIAHNAIKYKAEVERDLQHSRPLTCMPNQISQIFVNLFVNAAQAIKKQGTITVRTRDIGPDILIEVADTGSGMSEDVRARIFDPFFTTKPVGQGTGLGLAIVYGIIERHRGTITVESAPGKGTCFQITLPVNPTAADAGDDQAQGDDASDTPDSC